MITIGRLAEPATGGQYLFLSVPRIFRIYLFGEKVLTKTDLYKLYKKRILGAYFHKLESYVIHIEKWLKIRGGDLYTVLSTISTEIDKKMVWIAAAAIGTDVLFIMLKMEKKT